MRKVFLQMPHSYQMACRWQNLNGGLKMNHLAVYVRIVTCEDASGYLYGDDRVVLDYNWLRQVFVCLNPVTGRLASISEEKIKNGTIKVRFYSVSKE